MAFVKENYDVVVVDLDLKQFYLRSVWTVLQ